MTAKRLTALLIAFWAAVSVTVIWVGGSEDGPATVTIRIGSDRVVADTDNQQQAAEQQVAAEGEPNTPEIHEDARDETPAGITRGEADEALVTPGGVGPPRAPTGAQNYRCERNLVQNFSNRAAGTKVSMFVLHIAVVRPGALAAVRRLFDTPSFGASSTYGMELDGECEVWVDPRNKPWTQGAFNSVSESIEIMTNLMTREQWLRAPIIRDGTLASLVADRLRVRGLPPRLVDPVGCTPKAGYTDHDRLECGNSHVDVGTGFPWDVFGRQVRAAYSGPSRRAERSHRIIHAKLRARCRQNSRGCALLRSRNRALHKANPGL